MAAKSQAQKKEESALRKRRLAERINDNAMLIAAIRFYLACLLPERRADADQLFGRCKDLSFAWRRHLRAARRVLDVRYRGRTMTLAGNWAFRLGRVGLEVCDCLGLRQEFKSLNADLAIDDAMRDYAASNWQVLEETKHFLRGDSAELPGQDPPVLSDYGKHLESHVMASVREHFIFDRELDLSGAGVDRDFPVRYPIEDRGSRSFPHRSERLVSDKPTWNRPKEL